MGYWAMRRSELFGNYHSSFYSFPTAQNQSVCRSWKKKKMMGHGNCFSMALATVRKTLEVENCVF